WGPARALVVVVGIFVVGTVLAAAAPSMPLFIVGRFLQGWGLGAQYAVSLGAVAKTYPEAHRPRVLALLSGAWILPSIFGPSFGALLASTVGRRHHHPCGRGLGAGDLVAVASGGSALAGLAGSPGDGADRRRLRRRVGWIDPGRAAVRALSRVDRCRGRDGRRFPDHLAGRDGTGGAGATDRRRCVCAAHRGARGLA